MIRDKGFTDNFSQYAKSYKEFKKYSSDEIDEYQKTKLNEIIRYAFENSNFYNKLYKHLNFSKDIDINDIPIINKNHIKENFDDIITIKNINKLDLSKYFEIPFTFENRYLNKYLAFHTSGSTGDPAYILWGEREFAITTASYYLKLIDLLKSDKHLSDNTNRIAYIGIVDDYVGGNSWAYSMKEFTNLKIFSIFTPKEQLFKELNEYNPNILMTKPSLLGELARKQKEKIINLNLKKVIFAGEMISPTDLKDIENYFGIKVNNSYSTCETGPIGFQFDENVAELNIFEDMVYLELIDDNGNKIENYYEEGNIVITNLYNKTMPFIRYNLGDRAFFIPNKNSNRYNTISYILGRGTSFFTLKYNNKEVKLSEYPFWSLYVPGIYRYQVIQEDLSSLNIKIQWDNTVNNLDKEKTLRNFSIKLERLFEGYEGLKENINLKYEIVNNIEPNKSGKIQITSHL